MQQAPVRFVSQVTMPLSLLIRCNDLLLEQARFCPFQILQNQLYVSQSARKKPLKIILDLTASLNRYFILANSPNGHPLCGVRQKTRRNQRSRLMHGSTRLR
jgi:hypothetical protein